MANSKKAPADAVTSAEAAGTALGGSIPAFDSIKQKEDSQGILALLLHGESNAQSAAELARIMGFKDSRPITKEIYRLRLLGAPLCATGKGYFLPNDTSELARYTRAFDRRLRQIRATREALNDMLNEATGQTTIDAEDGGERAEA